MASSFGPYDYRTERGNLLHLVEGAHFLPYIEANIRGKTDTTPDPDIAYTLRVFPNHHRALISMMRHAEKEKTPKPSSSCYTIECWFDRAIRFRPDDTTVRMIFATYLNKNNQEPEAIAPLKHVEALAKDNAFTQHNIGLVYFDMKLFDKDLAQTHKAMTLGFEKPRLRELLEKAGQWKEPDINPMAPAALPASASASAN